MCDRGFPPNACIATRCPLDCITTLLSSVNPRLVNEKKQSRQREEESGAEAKRGQRCTGRERACDVGEATVHATRTNGTCRRSGYMMREGMLFLAT